MNIFKSKIDRLADKRKKLTEKRERFGDKIQIQNARISAEITRLQLKSMENDDKKAKVTKQINFKIDRVIKELEAEKEYVNAISLDETDEYLKDKKNKGAK
jgi:hypothetical protein